MRKKLHFLLLLFFGMLNAQTTVNLTPSKDNTIYSENSNSNALGRLYSGQNNAGNNRRGLIQFDLSSIPNNAVISSVEVTFNVDNVNAGAGNNTFNLHRLTKDWGEGTSNGGGSGSAAVAPDATWTDAMLGTSSWTNTGGDFEVSSASLTVDATLGNKTFISNTALVSDVQNWVNGTNANFGWALVGDETSTTTTRRFGSKELGTAPVLTVTYTVPLTITINPSKDNSIFEESLNNSNGTGPLFSGKTCFSRARRALMYFDVSAIPSNAVITNVALDLNVNLVSLSGTSSDDYSLHRVTSDWGEGTSNATLGLGSIAVAPDATWSNAISPSTAWATPGGDYILAASGTETIPNATGLVTFDSTTALIQDVQDWVNGTNSNFGWILIGEEGSNCTARRFDSREGTTPPALKVTYSTTLSTSKASNTFLSSNLIIYPNPSETGVFEIKTSYKIVKIEIFDALGKRIKLMSDFSSNPKVDLSANKSGLFLLKAYDEDGNSLSKRVIIN